MPRITTHDANCATIMADFNEARSPLNLPNVQAWGKTNFSISYAAVPRPAKLKWHHLDEFQTGRPIWRSLGRSAHKRLLVIGGYAPGPDIEEDGETVLAHVHSDEAEVSFFRTAETEDGEQELQACNSTSTVAFHAPFCDVGSDTGGSKAIHRVSALILYYFLAAGHVKELVRNKSDPTMFTRNFKDACAWIKSGGERPQAPPSRRSSGMIPSPPLSSVPVRPKRSSTICKTVYSRFLEREDTQLTEPPASVSHSISGEIHSPPFKRSATDSISIKIKREREEEVTSRPKKHPRRTLSEQIIIPKLQELITSPKSPAPERVHRALQDRIDHLKEENGTLKRESLDQQDQISSLEDERDDLRRDVATINVRLAALEREVSQLKSKSKG